LTRTARILLFLLVVGTTVAWTETSANAVADSDDAAANPVAHVRKAQSWEYGPFVNWGSGVGDRSDFKFLSGGFQMGKPLFPVVKAGVFSGQFEFSGNVMPLWQAYTPAPHSATFFYTGGPCPSGQTCSYVAPEGGGTYRGVSLTPVILRSLLYLRARAGAENQIGDAGVDDRILV
jgi:hypothetical protein